MFVYLICFNPAYCCNTK